MPVRTEERWGVTLYYKVGGDPNDKPLAECLAARPRGWIGAKWVPSNHYFFNVAGVEELLQVQHRARADGAFPGFYELFPTDTTSTPVPVIADFDGPSAWGPAQLPENRERLADCLQVVCEVFLEVYGIKIELEDWVVLETTPSHKPSWHVALRARAQELAFASVLEQRWFWEQVTKRLREHEYELLVWDATHADGRQVTKTLVDDGIYNKNRAFRLCWSAKCNRATHRLTPLDDTVPEAWYYCNFLRPGYRLLPPKRPAPVAKRGRPAARETAAVKRLRQAATSDKTIPLPPEVLARVSEVCSVQVCFGEVCTHNPAWIRYNLPRTDHTQPCPFDQQHSRNNVWVLWNPETTEVRVGCFGSSCRGRHRCLGYTVAPTADLTAVDVFRQRYVSEGPAERCIVQHLRQSKTVAVKSAMGSGKTVLLQKLLDDDHYVRAAYFTNRITQAIEGCRKLKTVLYQDQTGELWQVDRIAIQIDSLPRLIRGDDRVPSYDLVILDEICSSLQYFSRRKLQDKAALWKLFVTLCSPRHARHLIALDADLGEREFRFLRHVRDTAPLVQNLCAPRGITHEVFSNKGAWREELFKDLDADKNVALACNSKLEAQWIVKKAKERYGDEFPLKLYYAGSSDQDKRDVLHCDEEWVNYRLVVYTPTIGSGVDCSVVHFHVVFGYFTAKSSTYREFKQQLGRVRNPIDRRLKLHLRQWEATDPLTTDLDELREELRRNKLWARRIDAENLHAFDEGVKWVRVNAFFEDFLLRAVQEQRLSRNSGKRLLLDALRENGPVWWNKGKAGDEWNDESESWVQPVLDARCITPLELEQIEEREKQSRATAEDKVLAHKHRLLRVYDLDPDDLTEEFLLLRGHQVDIDRWLRLVQVRRYEPDELIKRFRERQGVVATEMPLGVQAELLTAALQCFGWESVHDRSELTSADVYCNLIDSTENLWRFQYQCWEPLRQCYGLTHKWPVQVNTYTMLNKLGTLLKEVLGGNVTRLGFVGKVRIGRTQVKSFNHRLTWVDDEQ